VQRASPSSSSTGEPYLVIGAGRPPGLDDNGYTTSDRYPTHPVAGLQLHTRNSVEATVDTFNGNGDLLNIAGSRGTRIIRTYAKGVHGACSSPSPNMAKDLKVAHRYPEISSRCRRGCFGHITWGGGARIPRSLQTREDLWVIPRCRRRGARPRDGTLACMIMRAARGRTKEGVVLLSGFNPRRAANKNIETHDGGPDWIPRYGGLHPLPVPEGKAGLRNSGNIQAADQPGPVISQRRFALLEPSRGSAGFQRAA